MKVLLILVGLIVVYVTESSGTIRDGWVDPHAWDRPTKRPTVSGGDQGGGCADCPPCPDTLVSKQPSDHNNPGEFLYRKLINFMINEERMNYDPDTEQYHRSIHIRLDKEQYNRIRQKGIDLRDMDGVLQDIWEQSRQGTMELLREVLWTWNESLHNFWTGCLSSRLLINCLQFASIVLAYCWAKDRGLNVAAIVFAATAFYVYRYLDDDCHRKLDIERIANLAFESANPCLDKDTSWYGSFFGYSQKVDCIKYLEAQSEKTCNAKDIYDGFMKEFVFDSMGMFFESFVNITAKVLNTHGYMGLIVVCVLIYFNVAVLITSAFKYVFGPVIMRVSGSAPPHPNYSPTGATAGDQLTGSNIDRLLMITENSTSLLSSLSKTFLEKQPSGVEVLDLGENRVLPALDGPAMNEEGAVTDNGPMEAASQVVPEDQVKEEGIVTDQNAKGDGNGVPQKHDNSSVSVPNLPMGISLSEFEFDHPNNNLQDDPSSDDDIVVLGRFDDDDEIAHFDNVHFKK